MNTLSNTLTELFNASTSDLYKSDDGYVYGYKFPHQFVGNLFTPDRLNKLSNNTPVFIAAPTGTGKSTTVLKQILPMVKSRRKRLLILGPRTCLMEQYKNQAASIEAPELLDNLSLAGMKAQHKFGDIDVYTHQQWYHVLTSASSLSILSSYGAVICDEAHFFIQDAAFNETTYELLELILSKLHHALRFYLTATPESCLDSIIEAEKCHASKLTIFCNNYSPFSYYRNCFYLYYVAPNYKYIKPCFFTQHEEVIQLMLNDQSDNKYLVCVDNKEIGLSIEKSIGKKMAEYIDADLKNTTKAEEVTTIINEESFNKKVLIATSFLDVGINLSDKRLRNIVIYSTSKTHFLQSIGRKRISTGENIRLLIYIPPAEYFTAMLKSTKYALATLANDLENVSSLKSQNLSLTFPFYLKVKNGVPNVNYNGFTFCYLKYRIKELEDWLACLDGCSSWEKNFAMQYLGWIGLQQQYDEFHWLSKKPLDIHIAISDFLEQFTNRNLAEEEYSKFRKGLTELHNELLPTEKWRTDRLCHLRKINRFLTDISIPYTISNVGNGEKTYRIERG
ncbi:DEAD/DEAH box helicase family protein [Lacrimispora sp.]|uniref:DEAD/DEAH box helicase family protein n=1 Tax=Lacrimispora sp. TaxID=2719234 RepID=UPI0028B1FB92|nr:DEAD/DEAH box helicase family protein [Lacrimispora sp.]